VGIYRKYLLALTRARIGADGKLAIDPSDIVQQTLLTAHERIGDFRGSTPEELRAWLRAILTRKIIDAARKLPKSRAGWVASVERGIEDSSRRLENWIVSDESSPLARLLRNERLLLLTAAMARLPDEQRSVLEARYLLGLSVPEIAEAVDKTRPAVAGLLRRGLEALRVLLDDSSAVTAP
jgi:RNA polymerase sigma-70 factor, ECF subfamily